MDPHSTLEQIQHWLDRLHAGDPNARNEIIRHAQDRLLRLTRQMLGGFPAVHRWEETSDVCQNVLLRLDGALRKIDLRTPRDFFTLAATHIRWELLDLARRHGGPLGLGANLAASPAAASGADAVDPADSSGDPRELELWCEMHSYIAALSEDQRQLFDLLYYQGLTQEESAAVLEMPLRTLKLHWQKARLRLMERLGNAVPF